MLNAAADWDAQHVAAPKAAAGQPAPHSRLCLVLLMVAAAVVFGAMLSQIVAVAPWSPTAAAGPCWQPHRNLTSDHSAAQQEQQEQMQQHLQRLNKQHEQQLQTLSAVQQAQQQVQAGVHQLQQLYEQLRHRPASGRPESSELESSEPQQQQQQQHQQQNTTQQPVGVICTVLRNEARYVPEWVAFHLLMGATKIVIYDDNSTDSLKDAAAPFGDSVVVVDMYKDVTGVPGDGTVHRVGGRQEWAFNHCKQNYAPSNITGWLGIWDVDEFVFPCLHPSVHLQDSSILWDTYTASTKAGAHGHELRCSLFGQNQNDTPQRGDELVLLNNIRRAADGLTEPLAAPKAWEAVAEGCDKCGGCCQTNGRKTIYNISRAGGLHLGTHGPHGDQPVIDTTWQKPLAGLCCNHYQFKSTDESRVKAAVNLNDHYKHVTSTPDAKKHLTMLVDTLIWQYVPNLLQLLQQKGFVYKVPEGRLLT